MLRTDFQFNLPNQLIAQRPTEQRSASRLLALDGLSGAHRDLQFSDLPSLLTAQDLLVFNDTRVVPARIHGIKDSGGKVEILLERALESNVALVQARASKGLKPAAVVRLPGGATARMLGREGDLFRLRFSCDVLPYFEAHGEMPLPPYVERPPESADRERYQTVYARALGAVAAPTAGLHFDAGIFAALEARGVKHAFVTLHVGAGTFQPLRVDELDGHVMHEEYLEVPAAACNAINAARAAGGRIIAVGTTVVRCLETAASAAADGSSAEGGEAAGPGEVAGVGAAADRGAVPAGGAASSARVTAGPGEVAGVGAAADRGAVPAGGAASIARVTAAGGAVADRGAVASGGAVRGDGAQLAPFKGATRIFIKPGYQFRMVDALVTNFHLPESTLLMLCAAFVGREALLSAYAHAVAARYRFFSYGDAMFLTPTASALDRA